MKFLSSGTKNSTFNITKPARYRNPKVFITCLLGCVILYLLFLIRNRVDNISPQPGNLDKLLSDPIQQRHDSQKSDMMEEVSHHFMTDVIDMMACSKQSLNAFNIQSASNHFSEKIIRENDNNGISFDITVNSHSFSYFQLCFATHQGHQHSFKISLVTVKDQESANNNNLIDQADCDMYLSASTFYPSSTSWDWKSDEKNGVDMIILNSYAHEFKISDLNTLFIGVTGKSADTSNHCILNVQVNEISTDMLLHKLSPQLRGGQVLLPRDIQRMKAAID